MTIEILRAITPFFTLAITIVVGVIAYLLKDKIGHLEKKIGDLERDLKEVDKVHFRDQKEILQDFITKETFYRHAGKVDGIVAEIFKEIKGLSATLNQTIGEKNAREKNG